MAGLRKKPEDRKSYHLRVPLTAGQRILIEDAVKLDDDDKAGWARAILLTAAKQTIAQKQGLQSNVSSALLPSSIEHRSMPTGGAMDAAAHLFE